MRVIYKYPLSIRNTQIIEMPKDAEILGLKLQHGNPVIYAIVDPDNPVEEKNIVMKGTGFQINTPLKYIGTILVDFDTFVWHFFFTT